MPLLIGPSASALISIVLLSFWLAGCGTFRTVTTYILLGAMFGYTMRRAPGFSSRLAALAIAPLTTLETVEAKPNLRYGFHDLPARDPTRSDDRQTEVRTVKAQVQQHEEGLQHAKIEVHLKSERHHNEKYAILERKHMKCLAKAEEEKSRADALQLRCDQAEAELRALQKDMAPAENAHPGRRFGLEDRCHLLETTNEGLQALVEFSGRDFLTIRSAYQELESAHEATVAIASEVTQNYNTLQLAHERLQNECQLVAEIASKNSQWLEALREDAHEGQTLLKQMEEAAVEELLEDEESQAQDYCHWLTWGELCAATQTPELEPTPVPSTDVDHATNPNKAIPDVSSSSPPDAAHEWNRDLVPDSLFDKYLANDKEDYPEVTDWYVHGAICIEIGYDREGNPAYFRCVPQVRTPEGSRIIPGMLDRCTTKLFDYAINRYAILAGVAISKSSEPGLVARRSPVNPDPIWLRRGCKPLPDFTPRVPLEAVENPFDDCHAIDSAE